MRPATDRGTDVLPAAVVLVIGAGLAWTLRRPAFRGAGRRAIAGIAAATALMAVVGTASAGYAERTYDASFAQSLGGLMAPPASAKDTVCHGTMTETCARRAAERVHRSFAWLPFPANPELHVVAARGASRAVAYEHTYVPSHLMTIEIQSGTGAGEPLGSLVRTVSWDGATATVRLDKGYAGNGGILQVAWTHGGQTFEMDGMRLVGPELSSDEIDALIALWRQVRYTDPGPSASAGRSGSGATGGA